MLKEQADASRDPVRNEAKSPIGAPDSPVKPADKGLARDRFVKEDETARAPAERESPVAEHTSAPPAEDSGDRSQGEVTGRPPGGFLRRRPVASSLGLLLLATSLGVGYVWWDYASHFEATDDAFIASRPIAIAPKVAGYVTDVPVTDNQQVTKGEVIARIDDRDYRIAVEQANAQVASAEASIKNIDAQIAVQRAQIEASQSQVEQARATLVFAQQQSARYDELALKGAGSEQNAQQYNSQLAQQQAALKSAQAGLEVARRQVEALKAQRVSAEASLAQAEAQRDQAKLNLSYATVTATEPGRIVNLTAEPGEFAQAGANLSMFVPDDIWVTANYKENQLDAMRPGQKVTVSIDAYPERAFAGHVASIQAGSGTAFALLPAQNATGNYVKVVQRVPVKIVIDHPPGDVVLGPGMSVVPSVRVDARSSLYERMVAAADQLWKRS